MTTQNTYADIDYLNTLVGSQTFALIVLLGVCWFLYKRVLKADERTSEERTIAENERKERRETAKELSDARKEYIPILINVTSVMEGLKNAILQKIK